MIAQVMLLKGPHNEEIISLGTKGGAWPTEIRIAYGDGPAHPAEKIDASVYVLDVMEKWGSTMYLGSYMYTGIKATKPTLITVWNYKIGGTNGKRTESQAHRQGDEEASEGRDETR